MIAASVLREVSWARVRGGQICECFDFALEGDAHGAFEIKGGADRSADFGTAALAAYGRLASRLPPACRAALLIEMGTARFAVGWPGGPDEWRDYLLAEVAGIVLYLGPPSDTTLAVPWSGESDEPIASDLPVVLGPSALHNLVRTLIDVPPEDSFWYHWSMPPGLTIVDTARAAYPPQDQPWEIDGRPCRPLQLIPDLPAASVTPLLAEGDDVAFSLLARSERWLRPLCSLYDADRRNIEAHLAVRTCWPERCLVLETLLPLEGPKLGPAEWEVRYALRDATGDRLWGQWPLRAIFGVAELLAAIAGALDVLAPACDPDPIEGATYGLAPPVLTTMSAGDLRLGATS